MPGKLNKYAVVQWPGDGHHTISDVLPFLEQNRNVLAGRIVVLPELINRSRTNAGMWVDVEGQMDVALQTWCRDVGCVVITSLHRHGGNWSVVIGGQGVNWLYQKVKNDHLGACRTLGAEGARRHQIPIVGQRHVVYVCMDFAFAELDALAAAGAVVIIPSNMGDGFSGGGKSAVLPPYLRGNDVLLANRFYGGCKSFIALRDGTVSGCNDALVPGILFHPPLTDTTTTNS
jgi:hypothetical protein